MLCCICTSPDGLEVEEGFEESDPETVEDLDDEIDPTEWLGLEDKGI